MLAVYAQTRLRLKVQPRSGIHELQAGQSIPENADAGWKRKPEYAARNYLRTITMSADVTTLLGAIRGGEMAAANRLFDLLYRELKQLAHRQLSRQSSQGQLASLDTTALVHESYLKLIDSGELKPEDRKHFFAYTASVMRSVIGDFARSQLAEKRGGQQLQVTLNTGVADSTPADNVELLQIHEAIDEFTAIDPRMGKLVEMRYFAGLSEQEAADALEISKRTAQRDWEKARLFLYTALKGK
jgi:RNA polymerase sigma factor (TIGR02999 family)